MPVIGNFSGANILQMPAGPAPKSIEWTANDIAAVSTSPFSGNQQIFDWQAAYLTALVSLPPLTRPQADQWVAFLLSLRGQINTFLLGDLTHPRPAGSGLGSPAVFGSGQGGYHLATRGWQASAASVLLPGDWLQIGYRLYRNLEIVNADSSGNATLSLWPNLRESPSDGDTLVLTNTAGLWRLKSSARKWSVNEARIYGITFEIQEALFSGSFINAQVS